MAAGMFISAVYSRRCNTLQRASPPPPPWFYKGWLKFLVACFQAGSQSCYVFRQSLFMLLCEHRPLCRTSLQCCVCEYVLLSNHSGEKGPRWNSSAFITVNIIIITFLSRFICFSFAPLSCSLELSRFLLTRSVCVTWIWFVLLDILIGANTPSVFLLKHSMELTLTFK